MPAIQSAPRGFWPILRQIGPGLIISASIVGSGELIATPTLGARVGFAALWLVILSCVIKVVVQVELGRYVLTTGETTFQALDRVPGPRWRVSWVVWCWMLMFVGVSFQSGGMLGGVGQIFHMAFPQLDVRTWAIIVAPVTALLLISGRYKLIETSSTFMVVSFTFITIACAVMLIWTPYAPRPEQILGGLKFYIPEGGLAVAFAVFGITGVGATELIYYPYWCLEKGYARFVGKSDGSALWLERARGWLRVMQTDALVAMAIYTVATVAFYVLGSSVLHGLGKIPSGYEMVRTLSNIYTSTLGNWAVDLFLVGAFFVLYSTVFVSTASNSRVIVDFLELIRLVMVRDDRHRSLCHHAAVVTLLVIYTVWFLWLGEPVLMVIIGGVAQACMLPVIGFSAIYLRYRHTHPSLRPPLLIDALLWLCSTLMLGFAVYTLVSKLAG
ncbi:MAG: Nramp family divalent metal transporter [Verrucomicrobia bacterium]|nr:Nramp family divalent metal transporter [Verrucomicrobiota bacterium]